MKKVLFTIFWSGAFRPVILYQGDRTMFDTGRVPDDEGWGRSSAIFEFDGDTVTMERFTEGRDCDGYLSTYARWTCPASRLRADQVERDGVIYRIPDWIENGAEVFDEQAARAGY